MNPKIEWLLLINDRSISDSVTIIKMSNGFPVHSEHVEVGDASSFCKGFVVAKDRDHVKVYDAVDA